MTAVVSALLPPMLLLLVHLLTRLTAIRTLCRQFSQRNVARLPRQVSDACACAHVTSPPPSVQQASQQRSTWAHHCRHRCRCQLSSRLALPSARHLVPNVANSAHAHARARARRSTHAPTHNTHSFAPQLDDRTQTLRRRYAARFRRRQTRLSNLAPTSHSATSRQHPGVCTRQHQQQHDILRTMPATLLTGDSAALALSYTGFKSDNLCSTPVTTWTNTNYVLTPVGINALKSDNL
jgi:hypothetical protein